jgi:hypothetical protein
MAAASIIAPMNVLIRRVLCIRESPFFVIHTAHYCSTLVPEKAPLASSSDEPQTTLVALVPLDEPHTTLNPLVTLLPQTTELPHTTELPETFAPHTTDDPHTTDVPHTTDEGDTELFPFDTVTVPVEAL